ncbi:hypothetical protein Taro_057009 [Colocasia esculenta]|uniref:Pectinesterase n=1 Tax=Colocasia esculenta TaxID=4460 RepID=A0A843XVF1_COLES|nr:hypothetical protein [Colocasia esculenta]
MHYGEDESRRKKKVAVMSISAVLLVAMVVGVAVTATRMRNGDDASSEGQGNGDVSASVKAIESFCQPTDYKQSCVSALTKATGSNITDPAELVKLAFNVAVDEIRNVFNHSAVLKEAAKDPRTSHALQNCQELLEYAIDDIKQSAEKLSPFDVSKVNKALEDLKIWLTAAATYQETCLDGFQNTTGKAGADMRKAMNLSMELTDNTLALVDSVADVFASFKLPSFNRKLLAEEEALAADGFPTWVDARRRRLLQAGPGPVTKPDAVVAKDGSGDYTTINAALEAVPKKSNTTFVIYVKAGVYDEIVLVDKSLTNVMMIGDGPTLTKVTGSLNFYQNITTFKTATFTAQGSGFIAKDMGFENSAGPEKHQAVALLSTSDMSIFYRCQMDGYQDTLYAHSGRQFYRECTISGTIDFIFGNGAVILQNCVMLVRQPLDNQQNIVTAQGRKQRRHEGAIIIHNSTITADSGFARANWAKNPSFLGRPWKEYSRTFILQSEIDEVIDPKGWLPWAGEFGLKTCFYTEFDNRGPGSKKEQRVTWKGIRTIDYQRALRFTVESFLRGNTWIRPTGIPYIPSLLPVSSTTPAA